MVMAYGFDNKEVMGILQMWPCIEIGKGTECLNPLQDSRVTKNKNMVQNKVVCTGHLARKGKRNTGLRNLGVSLRTPKGIS